MCSLSMYNHNRVTVNAADSLLDGGIHLKEAKKKVPQFHDMIYPMTHDEEIDHTK